MMKKVLSLVAMAAIGSLIVFGLKVHAQSKSKSSIDGSGVTYQVTTVVTEKAMNPMPGQNAKQQSKQSTIGKGKAMVKTSKNNSFWVEEIDMDGSGKPAEAQMLWDDTDKVLYMYADKSFNCADGSSGNGDFLIATYGQGNSAKKPAGSGWWVAGLDQGECKASTEEAYGCKFDGKAQNTTCGVAKLNEKTNDLTIIEATTTSNQ
jgi:hypothetical protein